MPREDFFLVTKLNNPDQRDAAKALEYSLKQLETSYIDLCACYFLFIVSPLIVHITGLMHWPAPANADGSADKSWNWLDTWKSMEEIYKQHPDKVKAIGVSNVLIYATTNGIGC